MIGSALLSGAMGLLGTGINHISNAFNRNRQESREDSSYQRTMADMREAGLSPMAMSGTDSSTPVAQSTSGSDTVNGAMNTLGMISQIARTGAEIEGINATTLGTNIDNQGKQKNQDYLNKHYLGSSIKKDIDTDWRAKCTSELSKIADKMLGDDPVDTVTDALGNAEGKTKDRIKQYEQVIKDGAIDSVIKGIKTAKVQKTAMSMSEKLKYYQTEINKYSGKSDRQSLSKVNELRQNYEDTKNELVQYLNEHYDEVEYGNVFK